MPETGGQRLYPWGQLWHIRMGRFGTTPSRVGNNQNDISGCGCHDMGGNVNEWTLAVGSDDAVLRGGSFGKTEELARVNGQCSYRRVSENRHARSLHTGFRLACELD